MLASSTLLFYLGVAFAYYLVLPTVFKFFVSSAPEGVAVMTDVSKYLDFVLKLFMAFGFVFEMPVAIVLMVLTGFVTPAQLAAKRDYVLVGVFVAAAVLTPPDVLSQIMLAVPAYLLYELGILVSRWLSRDVEASERVTAFEEAVVDTDALIAPALDEAGFHAAGQCPARREAMIHRPFELVAQVVHVAAKSGDVLAEVQVEATGRVHIVVRPVHRQRVAER